MTGYMGQWKWHLNGLSSLNSMVGRIMMMLADSFDERCDFGMQSLKYHLLVHLLENVQGFRALPVLDSSPYEHLRVRNNQAYNRILRRRRTRMTVMVGATETTGESAVIWEEKGVWEAGMGRWRTVMDRKDLKLCCTSWDYNQRGWDCTGRCFGGGGGRRSLTAIVATKSVRVLMVRAIKYF